MSAAQAADWAARETARRTREESLTEHEARALHADLYAHARTSL